MSGPSRPQLAQRDLTSDDGGVPLEVDVVEQRTEPPELDCHIPKANKRWLWVRLRAREVRGSTSQSGGKGDHSAA